jgi:branched-chain amino acid transport system ATP-binding protein
MLQVEALHTYYGLSHVLQGISLQVGAGELVALIGRNGAGKSTTLKTIFGITPARSGRVVFEGREITHMPTYQIPLLGMCYVPEERRIFPGLSVYENLRIALLPHKKRLDLSSEMERVFGFFPRLRERCKQYHVMFSGMVYAEYVNSVFCGILTSAFH